MPLSAHIRTLLRDHDCVIIPDFGGLIADYAPARIHPVRHTLAPPSKRVAFNQSLTRNDGLLVDALCVQLNLSPAQARQMIREAVTRMQQELEASQRTELTGVGIFRRSAGRGLEFEYTGTDNLLTASFGLPELVARPVRATDALLSRERQPAAPQLAAGRVTRAGRVLRGAVTAVLVGLVFSANYMFADQQGYLPEALRLPSSEPVQHASLPEPTAPRISRQQAALATTDNFEAIRPEPKPAAAAPVVAVTKPAPVAKAAAPVAKAVLDGQGKKAPVAKPAAKPAPKAPGWEKAAAGNATPATAATTIKSRTGRYYVIAGSYTTMVNAEKGRQALVRLGHPARIITPPAGSRQYKLSVADFADRTSADRQATILRKRMGNTLWVLNY
ncbi:SPOR domain-containing protein [Hymenobacter sp. BT186]|uniref:SPOR domain-containing protein n=1 Tax=Hymenobacter telluris TaxID=2816474 RepID=A0A939EWU0_9BACT|nr:SPOR domain-containing protein [Hymenobacter telluris]MBO0358491.1 SPOR domain-containing protein [Hymenobacter telluris]MBW3374517.1 SPOR domain-containing protein [Hymenobacter norwichensis]